MKRRKERKDRTKRRITRAAVGRFFLDTLCYLAGGVAYALSVVIFTAPNHIAPGGLTGIATVLNFLDGRIPIGATILAMNVPLLIASWFKGGRAFTVRTVICTVWSSVAIDLLTPYVPTFVKEDSLLVPIFGGLLMGVGLGLLFLRGACTGGSEIVARLFERRFPHLSVGRIILLVDAIVVTVAAFVFRDVSSAMYAVILVFVCSRVMDAIVYGGNVGKMALIMSDKEEEIATAVMQKLDRGCTKLESIGGYSGKARRVLLCAIRPSQLYALRRVIADIDPAAFVIVTTTDEVFGNGFRPVKDEEK